SSVIGQASKLGLKKSEVFRSIELKKQGERLRKVGVNTRLKPGQEPPNKGKKQHEFMSAEGIERSKAGRFKKGNLPHNTKYDGAERISKEGYIEIRVSLGKYRLKHLVIWEAANGPLPDGYCLWFKDQDKKNITLDNLELITRAENRIR